MTRKPRRGRGGDRRLHLAHNADAPEPAGALVSDPATQHLALEVRSRLRGDDPLDLLAYVSTLVVAAERAPAGVDRSPEVDLRLLVDTFVAVDIAETTALLSVLGHLTRDDDLRVLARRALMSRRQPMPPWLRDLDETEVTDAAVMTEIAGDGFDVVLGIRWPGGGLASFLVYVDSLHGVVVKDAFPTAEPFHDVVERLRELSQGIDRVQLEPLGLAEARAIVEGATDRGEASDHPFESDTWPSARPMLRWLLDQMPLTHPGDDAGGFGQRLLTQANDQSRAASVVEGFVGSAHAARIRFDGESAGDARCLGLIAGFAVSTGEQELAGWTPARLRVLFGHWLPSQFLFDDGVARRLPHVLRAFVEWSMSGDDLGPALRRETLAAVDREGADFVRQATSREATDLIAALRAYGRTTDLSGVCDIAIVSDEPDEPDEPHELDEPHEPEQPDEPEDLDHWDYTEFVLDACSERVGGRTALLALDDAPLPDEGFRWTGLPDDIRPRVEAVLALTDGFTTGHFDVELRTVCRRLLAATATADPELFRRKGRADTAAAALCWIAAKANNLLSTPGGMAAGELAERFGLKGSPSQRARVFLAVLDVPRFAATSSLGRPELLTSRTRASLIRRRDLALHDAD